MPTIIEMSASDTKRFWDRVRRGDGCWEWQGRKDRSGYGDFSLGGMMHRAHRIAHFLATGDNPGYLCVLHRCDNPSCVRPEHLWLGTNADNAKDRDEKGRGHNGKSRLTWNIVRAMRKMFSETDASYREVGRRFKTAAPNGVLSNRTWYDPDYTPPRKPMGPRSVRVEIWGETKTLREWARDRRCEVRLSTLRKKYREGVRGIELVLKGRTGRPRNSKSKTESPEAAERMAMARQLDREGMTKRELDEKLTAAGHRKLTPIEHEGLHPDWEVPARLASMSLISTWRCSQVAKELGIPYSVVLRYR